MPRAIFVPKKPDRIDSAEIVERALKRLRRSHRRTPKPRVVLGTAAARALGIGQ